MGDEELTNYILRSREKGRTKEQIIRALYSVGWKKEKVETAFQKLDQSKSWQQTPGAQSSQITAPPSTSAMNILQQSTAAKPAQAAPLQLQVAAAPAKKPLFSIPNIFAKKPASQVQPAPAQPSQPPAQQPASAPLQPYPTQPEARQQVQQPPPQAPISQPTQPSASIEPAQSPAPPRASPGVLPPVTTFTIGAQSVQFGATTARAEPHIQNPAFSNLASAAAAATAKKNFLPIAIIVAVLLLASAYYFFQMQKPQLPNIDGPRINLTQLDQNKKNVSKPPILPPPKPVVNSSKNTTNSTVKKPLQNTTKNSTQPAKNTTLPVQNGTGSLKPPANSTQKTPAQNTSSPPENQTGSLQKFSRYSQFTSSEGQPPSKFCQGKNAALYRVHYQGHIGIDCVTPNGKQNYSLPIDFPYACDFIPCCYNGPANEFSNYYDSFECGYYG